MNRFFLLSFFFLLVPPVFAGDVPPKEFSTLKDALVFIDHELDTHDWSGISDALFPPLQSNEPNRSNWTQLKDARGSLRLADVFADQRFPSSDDAYVIKVPRKQLIGGSRIKFIRSKAGWRINAVYIVR